MTNLRPILILLSDGFADWETGLISANPAEIEGLDVRHACVGGGEVTSLGGLRVGGLDSFVPRPEDLVVLCGGTIWGREAGQDLIDAIHKPLRAARARGAALAGICAGAGALARMGFLDGIRHTGNGRESMLREAGKYPGHDLYVDQAHSLRDQGIVTAAGTAPVSFAAAVLTEAGAPQAGAELGQYMGAEHRETWAL